MTEKEYASLVRSMSPRSKLGRDCLWAFFTGGLICSLGQMLITLYSAAGLPKSEAAAAGSMTLVLLSALMTGLSLYDDLAKHAGAGTLVPITGFANAVSAAALEAPAEGFITGVGVKMFTIAGPVIVYGTAASVVYGIIYWLSTRL